jgi:hypothetical protein
VCNRYPIDRAHIRTRAVGGTDTMPLCRKHHTEQHTNGIVTFCEKNPPVLEYVKSLGYYVDGRRLRKDGETAQKN